MEILYIIFGIVALIGLLFLAISIRYKIKLKPIKQVFETLTQSDKLKVYDLVSSYSEKPQTGAFLVPIEETNNNNLIVTIPDNIDSKWKGKSYKIDFHKDLKSHKIDITEHKHSDNTSILGGKIFKPVLTPRIINKNGKERNIWASRNLMVKNKDLKKYIYSLIEDKHVDLLASILIDKPILNNNYEPLYQIRIGDGLQWIQGHEYVKCDVCKKNMKYIFNLPGEYSGKKGYGELIYYVFGCKTHPEKIKYIFQAF